MRGVLCNKRGEVSATMRASYTKACVAFGWTWFALRFVALFCHNRAEYNALHNEADLLLKGPCAQANAKITGALIRCEEARVISNGKTLPIIYALEKTCKNLFLEVFRSASYELVNLVKLLGFLCTLLFTCAFLMHAIYTRCAEIKLTYQTPKERQFQFSPSAFVTTYKHRLPIAAPKRSRFDDADECADVDMRRIAECKFD